MSDEFAQWQEEHSPDRKTIGVCFDRELLFELEQASIDFVQLKDGSGGMLEVKEELKAAERRLEDLREKAKAAQRTLVFESLGTKKWRDLLSEHPYPGRERRIVVNTLGLPMEYNPDTFVPIAMSESCVEPGMTLKQATWFCETFPVTEVDRVFGAVLTVNVTGLERPFDDTGSPHPGAKRSTPR